MILPVPGRPSLSQRMALMLGWDTEVVIHAPLSVVWDVATDFATYSEWNPFVLEATAQFEVGQTIQLLEDLKQFGQHWITAEFLTIESQQRFVWRGHFAAPFLFTVHHTFQFEAIAHHQTRFRQVHQNSGLLPPLLAWRGFYWVTRQGYQEFDRALKIRCEEHTAQHQYTAPESFPHG